MACGRQLALPNGLTLSQREIPPHLRDSEFNRHDLLGDDGHSKSRRDM